MQRSRNLRASGRARARVEIPDSIQQLLERELCLLQQRMRMGFEVEVIWLPGADKYRNGRQLAEEVKGNTIFVYASNAQEALELVLHGFVEWILDQHTRPYRQLANSLIALFEDLQYDRKERLVEAFARVFSPEQTP